ncbi:MAG: carbohydrate ABC transporter permease [Lachnospiraceae bacterium]|nr:carbohydrate ABC transporter permease [Lachnospiraceae bacterium]
MEENKNQVIVEPTPEEEIVPRAKRTVNQEQDNDLIALLQQGQKKRKKILSIEKIAKNDKKAARIRKIDNFIKIFLATVIAAFFAVLFLMPIVLTISNSFMASSEISSNYGTVFATNANGGKVYISEKVNLKFIPDMVSFSQYSTVLFKSPEYLMKFWNSVILVGPIVLFQLIVATLASYGFARYTGKVRGVIFFAYVILMLMPYQVTLVPNYLVSNWLNILDTYWAIWLPGIFSPFAVYLLTKFMKRIPNSMIEAAQIDGAGEWQIYRKICMPLCKGAICSAAILVFIDYWNMVEQPLILLADGEKHPLSVFLSKINSGEVGLAFAVATIYMVPTLLVFLYGEEYLVDGITYQGGVKG